MDFNHIILFLYAAILAGVPLLYGTLGEIIIEKSGNLNLGVEGMMYLGAIASFLAAYTFESAFLAIIFGFIAGMLGALIYAFLTVSLKANQNVTGLTLTVFGTGVANFIGERLKMTSEAGTVIVSDSVIRSLLPMKLGALSDIPVIGKLVFNHSILTYLSILFAILMSLYLNRSRLGLNLRAIGENPSAADAMGIDVNRYKYLHILFGGGLCGLGGVYIALVTCVGNWQPNIIGGQGWIAVALVIFASWKPLRAVFGSLIFGALSMLRLYIPKNIIDIPASIFNMLPFAVTCLVLVISSIRMKRENQQPAACGVNYFREER
ncbi:MAG: ABC transporter permease [Christensenellaceae bacterium]|nr:ABC transporter permease [Christensenellaceae bacterium]